MNKVQLSLWNVSGATVFRIPKDAGFSVGKTYRVRYDGECVYIHGSGIAKKRYVHATNICGVQTADRTTWSGTLGYPVIRIGFGTSPGLYDVEYEPGERKVVIHIAKKMES